MKEEIIVSSTILSLIILIILGLYSCNRNDNEVKTVCIQKANGGRELAICLGRQTTKTIYE